MSASLGFAVYGASERLWAYELALCSGVPEMQSTGRLAGMGDEYMGGGGLAL